jgi:hypothetical protein
VLEWAERLRCSECGSRDTDFVVTGDGGHPMEGRRQAARIGLLLTS